jgi:hypothetical protein
VSERLQEPGTEEALPELSPAALSQELPPPVSNETAPPLDSPAADTSAPSALETPPAAAATVSWLRLAYSFLFLLAVLAVLTLWSEVGGQGHLDLMPWYTKLACVMVSAWCCVRLTAGLVEERTAWSSRTLRWLAGLLLVATAMAAITYYYHLHEEPDQSDSDETSATVMTVQPAWRMRSSAQ